MPLKDVDLKTFEAYKKAIRLDLPKVTAGTKFWIYKDVELPTAAGKKQKIASFLALVDDKAIKPLLKGKALLCKGTCILQEGRVAFDAETGKVPYKQLKTSLPLFLGKAVLIPSTANADEDTEDEGIAAEDESETETAPKSTQAQNGPTAQTPVSPGLGATWNKLVQDVQAAVAAHPERKDALTRAAAGIPDLIKANKADEARQRMDALAAMLSASSQGTAPPQPAGLGATWNKLVKDVQAAAAAHPERKDALTRAAAGIPDLIKANKSDEARQKMDALQALLDAPAATSSATAPPTSAELTSRWNALVKEMQAEAAAHPEKKADLVRASAGIPDMIKAGKLDLAKKLMDGVQAVLKGTAREKSDEASATASKAQGTASEGTGKGVPYEGLVKYRRSLFEFAKAKTAVRSQIDALKKAIPSQLNGEQALADAIAQELNALNEEIGDAIDAAMQGAENVASPLTDAVKMSLQKYLAEVQSSRLVKHVDANPFGVSVSIEKTLAAALSNVRSAMPV